MNIQKGGEKNFLEYIRKYPTVNKDLITALNNPDQKLVDYLDKEAPVIIICMGLSICYKYKIKVITKNSSQVKDKKKLAILKNIYFELIKAIFGIIILMIIIPLIS